MKRLLICISVGLSLHTTELVAQHSLPSHAITSTHRLSHSTIAEDYIRLQHLYAQPRLSLRVEQRDYIRAFASYLDKQTKRKLDSPLAPHIDKGRIELLQAIAYYQQGEEQYPLSLALLSSIAPSSLHGYEQAQHSLLQAYLLLQGKGGIKPNIDKARTLLSTLSQQNNILGEQATLYMSSLVWQEGKPQEAQRLLEGRSWSDELMPEVEYQGALLSYSLDEASTALAATQSLLRKYPEMQARPRLKGLMAQAYYKLGDYHNAIQALEHIPREDLLPEEQYLLGVAHYELKHYDQAIPHLQRASLAEGRVKGLAQYALGSIYQSRGEQHLAQLALESALQTIESKDSLREHILYRLLELGHSGGYDAFGKQIRVAEEFLSDYPQSSYRPRVLEIIRAYIGNSKHHATAIKLIDKLRGYGLKLDDLKQDLLYKHALQRATDEELYITELGKAIALGNIGSSYPLALNARSEYYLRHKQYSQAERDAELSLKSAHSLKGEELYAEYLLGYSLFNQKRFVEAVKPFSHFATHSTDTALRTDAYLRIGDSYLAGNRLNEALSSYKEAQQASSTGNAEALYRLSGVYAKQGQYRQQIAEIEQARKHFPESPYMAQMLYDKGRSERIVGQTKEALQSFGELRKLYPLSSVAPTAMLEQALIYSNLGQDDQAIQTYKELIQTYPDSREAEMALSDLKSLYSEQNQLDEYLAYLRTLGGRLRPSEQDEAHIAYLALADRAKRKQEGLEVEIANYLQKYPNSSDKNAVRQLLVEQYITQGKKAEAIQSLNTLLSEGLEGENKLKAQLQLADLLDASGDKAKAYKLYQQAYQAAEGTKLYSLRAGIGVLRTAYAAKQVNEAINVAKSLMKRTDLSVSHREEITLLKGKSEEANKSLLQAIESYSSLAKATNSPYGAEAIVRHADILLRLGKAKESQKVLEPFIASGTSQDYWLARAFVLLSDSHDRQGDSYLAKQYIESLRDNYTGSEADIQEMIEQRLKKYSK